MGRPITHFAVTPEHLEKCPSGRIEYASGQLVCTETGEVLEEHPLALVWEMNLENVFRGGHQQLKTMFKELGKSLSKVIEAIELYRQGLPIEEIMRRTGIRSYKLLYMILRSTGAGPSRRRSTLHRSLTLGEALLILADYLRHPEEGLVPIGRRYGRSPSSTYLAIVKAMKALLGEELGKKFGDAIYKRILDVLRGSISIDRLAEIVGSRKLALELVAQAVEELRNVVPDLEGFVPSDVLVAYYATKKPLLYRKCLDIVKKLATRFSPKTIRVLLDVVRGAITAWDASRILNIAPSNIHRRLKTLREMLQSIPESERGEALNILRILVTRLIEGKPIEIPEIPTPTISVGTEAVAKKSIEKKAGKESGGRVETVTTAVEKSRSTSKTEHRATKVAIPDEVRKLIEYAVAHRRLDRAYAHAIVETLSRGGRGVLRKVERLLRSAVYRGKAEPQTAIEIYRAVERILKERGHT